MNNEIKGLELNGKGYLINYSAWNKDFAMKMAKENNLKLSECHWLIINFLRNYYSEFGVAPDAREVIKTLGKTINPNLSCTRKQLDSLFSNGGCKLACKIAGLPNCHCKGV